jgi:hypothetical protein
MFFNPLLIAAVALGALLFLAGFRLARKNARSRRWWNWTLAVLSSLPALACTAYYLHLIQDTPMYIALRSLPGFEALSGGIGLLAGMLTRVLRLPRRWKWAPGLLGFGLLLAPFLKPILLPVTMQGEFQDRWSDGVCLQSGYSTCGPASLATLMALHGDRRTEKETARNSYSSLTGTEIWYLVRLARNRGFLVSWGDVASLATVPVPAMIGTTMTGSGAGHFITLLGRTPSQLEVGDPLIGRRAFTAEQFAKRYRFSGRWLTIKRDI